MVTPFPETFSYLLVVLFPGLFLTEEKIAHLPEGTEASCGISHVVASMAPTLSVPTQVIPCGFSPHAYPRADGEGLLLLSQKSQMTRSSTKEKKKNTPPQPS